MTLFLVAIVVVASGLLGTLVALMRNAPPQGDEAQTLLAVELEMNPTDVYRHAIKRTLADLYGVARPEQAPPSVFDH